MRTSRFNIISALSVLGIIALSISACTKDYFNFDRLTEDFITWEPDIAFPVVYSIVDAEDIIGLSDSTNIYVYDPDNFITLIYRKRIFSQSVNDFFQLPQDQTLNSNMNLSAGEIATFTGSGAVQQVLNTGMLFGIAGPAGSQLDKMRFHSGTMLISFTSNFEHSGTLLVTMPEMRLNGFQFSQTYPIDFQGGAISVSIDIPLQGYEMDLDNINGANTIPIDYTLVLNQGGGAVPTPINQVQINHRFENMTMAFTDGNFGNFELVINPADVDLDVIQSDHGGNIYFEDPRLRLRIGNTIGAEIGITLDEFYATGAPGQLDVDLSSLITNNQCTIPAAPAVGDSAILEYYFTQNNSNIKEIVNDQYEQLHHDLSAEMNPNGPAYNFATLNSSIEVIADVELPFWGFSDHFTIMDTIAVPFAEAEDFADNVERAMLRINTLSHFPVDGLLKVYFADSAYAHIDSILTDGSYIIRSGIVEEIEPGAIPGAYRVIEAVNTNNDIELDSTRIHNLFASEYLLIAADITSTDDAGRNIKVFLEDNIEIRLGLRVKLKASPSDLDGF